MVAIIVDAIGVRPAGNVADVRQQVDAERFFWLDMFGGDGQTRALHLSQLGLEETDIASALRFGQAGRMSIGRQKLRAVTWMAEPPGNLIEVHLICCPQCIMTVWSGDATALDNIRQQFAERFDGFGDNFYHAAGILLQLLLGTLDHTIRNLDVMLDDLRLRLDRDARPTDFALLGRQLQRVQSIVASFNRYSSSARSAIVGIEAVAGMDARGAAELNDYVEQVEDVEEQLYERRRWLSDIMHDYATTIAQRQGEQINRLTLVSLIFLPVTALTGFFGMNFDWMNRALSSARAFFTLGVALPALCVILTVAWLSHRGLVQLRLWPFATTKPPQRSDDATRAAFDAPNLVAYPELGLPERSPEKPNL